MPENDPRELLSGYIMESLTKTEIDRLARAALEDDELFAQLYEAEEMRDAMGDPAFRDELKVSLRRLKASSPPSLGERVSLFFSQRWLIPVAGFALSALLIVLVRTGALAPDHPVVQVALGPAGGQMIQASGLVESSGDESERWRRSRQLPLQKDAKGSIVLDRGGDMPTYNVGDQQRIGFRLTEDARVVVLEERADGSILRLFPNRFRSDSLVKRGIELTIPEEGQGNLVIDGVPGKRDLRMLVFPPNVDPLSVSRSWDDIQSEASAVVRSYEVRP